MPIRHVTHRNLVQDFQISQLTLQFNYPPAYLLWDRAGELTRKVSVLWPGWKLEKAEAGSVQALAKNARVQMGLDMSYVIVTGPKGFGAAEQIAKTIQLWTSILELETIDKIGTRAIFQKKYADRESAHKAYLAMNLVNWPPRRVFDCAVDSPLNGGSAHLQFEDDQALTIVRVSPQQVAIEIPAQEEFPEIEGKKVVDRVIVDVDRQTKKPIDAARFSAPDWLKGYQHLLNRDLPEIVGK
ncbi:hypothetical protein H6CHR_03065 [Variovorax sp. PBL-H6]|nr:hypothetical protein H6CHR_03065 [Variovorax sp. PBL-H6]